MAHSAASTAQDKQSVLIERLYIMAYNRVQCSATGGGRRTLREQWAQLVSQSEDEREFRWETVQNHWCQNILHAV